MAKKIGIISDTHGLLRPEILEILEDCDCIFHGGDINKPEILDTLGKMGSLYAVRGNNDKDWAEGLSTTLKFKVEDVNFFMVHNKKDVSWELGDTDIVIFGHTHKYFEKEIDGRLWLNPGSCGPRRFDQEITMILMEVDGKKYGCELLGQQYTDEAHMWGRIMNIDVSTYTDENGKALMYAAPSNLSPASEEYAQLVAERVEKLRNANPEMDETAVPVDLVTCSGSGLDPHISPAAAEYQVARIAKATDMTEDEVREIIQNCTDGRFLGIFGEETVNVLEVNLMLDGILEK